MRESEIGDGHDPVKHIIIIILILIIIIIRESIVLLCVSFFPAHDGITSIFMRDDLLFLCFCLV